MNDNIIRDLGNGLILRHAAVEDTEELVAFQGDVHREPGSKEPEKWIASWTRDLMTKEHPTFDLDDFILVEDTTTGAIVSTLGIFSQTWTYEGVPFGVGRPELIGTLPDYRRRGLVRTQMEVFHDRSAEHGELVQAITGIPWYYRQFGYEMGMALGGGRIGYVSQKPKLKDGEKEPYHVRPAVEDDLPYIARVGEYGDQRSLVSCVRDQAMWRHDLDGRSKQSIDRRELCILETPEGKPVGFFTHFSSLWRNRLAASIYELEPGVSWLAVTPTVVRHLWAKGQELAVQNPKQDMEAIAFWMGEEHPVYQVFRKQLPQSIEPYAWYMRVPDLPGFLRHISPVLEQRLAESVIAGHSGELFISFYRDGLRLVLVD